MVIKIIMRKINDFFWQSLLRPIKRTNLIFSFISFIFENLFSFICFSQHLFFTKSKGSSLTLLNSFIISGFISICFMQLTDSTFHFSSSKIISLTQAFPCGVLYISTNEKCPITPKTTLFVPP